MRWKTTRGFIDLSSVQIMGIVNATPDSFSDGGRLGAAAIRHCEQLVADGAHILDIGAESSRPGADAVSVQEELERLTPVLRAALTLGVPVSVDTVKPDVMQAALELGADIVNDINALRDPRAQAIVVGHPACGVCLMHMSGTPKSMQAAPRAGDVVPEVLAFLGDRAAALVSQGVDSERITVDPGIGFGKTVEQNFSLLPGQTRLASLGYPILAGWSRKSSLGAVTGRGVADRMVASVAAALAAVQWGARIVRVHDVAQTRDALAVWEHAGLG